MAKITGDTEYVRSLELDKGVFAGKNEVAAIVNKSNHPSYDKISTIGSKNPPFEPEICLLVTFKDEGGRESEKYLFGKYLKDKVTGNIKDWIMQGNAVASFLYACVGRDNVIINDDFTIPETFLQKCIGKIVWKIDYVEREYIGKDGSMKAGYNMLDTFFPLSAKESTLIDYWMSRRTSVKKYNPSIYQKYTNAKKDKETSFDYGENQTDNSDESYV